MDAFVSRKKRKLSPPPSQLEPTNETSTLSTTDDDSTDFKLALLASLHPLLDQNVLLDLLSAHDGSVELASKALSNPDSPPRKTSHATGYQSSLSGFIAQKESGENTAKRAKTLSKKGKTLHLYDPADVAEHTPCSIIHNFLPPEEANALLQELLIEAKTFERDTFKLFDNVVQSPHTSCFYVDSYEEMKSQKTEYVYNGANLTDVRQLTQQMRFVSPKVSEAVNLEIAKRIKTYQPNSQKLKYQSSLPWKPNAALVNSYNGPTESVGYHSDQLTYLGPRATIGSISLGVAREFRVRRIIPQDSNQKRKSLEESNQEGQISIHLPHNSLLVLHAEMQEEWKHSISPAQTISPHPIAGNRRINITYRDYKESLHPRFTPRCKCNAPTVLRVVQRKKENWGRYFWMCYVGSVPGKEGCTFFEWAEFDDEGEPIWKGGKKKTEGLG